MTDADRYVEECHHCGSPVEAFTRECPECGFRRDTFEQPDPETACIECGDRGVLHCGCCGFPLCGKHHELGAGFCSKHHHVGGVDVCIYDHEVYVGVRGDTTVLATRDSDVYHLPDEAEATEPACRPQEASKTPVPLWVATEADRELCDHCESEARERFEAFREEIAAEFGGEKA